MTKETRYEVYCPKWLGDGLLATYDNFEDALLNMAVHWDQVGGEPLEIHEVVTWKQSGWNHTKWRIKAS